jgi:hypothetical protein
MDPTKLEERVQHYRSLGYAYEIAARKAKMYRDRVEGFDGGRGQPSATVTRIRNIMKYRGGDVARAKEIMSKTDQSTLSRYKADVTETVWNRAVHLHECRDVPLGDAIDNARREEAEMRNEQMPHPMFGSGEETPPTEAKDNIMFGSNQLFSQVENATWDLLTGKVGYRDGQSVVTINEKRITRNPIIGGALPPLPAFALPTNAAQIAVGDLVLNGETIIGFVIEKKEGGTFSTIDFNGRIGEWSAPEGILFGDTKVIRSLTSMLGAEQTGLQSMLMPFLLMGKDVGGMLPILLMSKIGVPGTDVKGFDPSMLMMMMAMGGGGFRK